MGNSGRCFLRRVLGTTKQGNHPECQGRIDESVKEEKKSFLRPA